MQRRALIAIPFQFAAAHALGYGLATRYVASGASQMAAILVGNIIGITAIGLMTARLLDIRMEQRSLRMGATAVACMIGILLVSQLTTHRYEALVVPILLGVTAFHLPDFRTAESPDVA